MTARFDEALDGAVAIAGQLIIGGHSAAVVRDVLGRCRVVVDDRGSGSPVPDDRWQAADRALAELSPHVSTDGRILRASDLFDARALLDDPDRALIPWGSDRPVAVPLIERTVTGAEWRSVEERPVGTPAAPQVVFYSLKGGVGRSTAAVFLARQLAEDGHCVVLVDLDLESPGLGGLLLTPEAQPECGIVDVMAESAVGLDIASEAIARCLDRTVRGNGEVWLAPAAGRPRPGYSYLPKLDRCYVDLPPTDHGPPRPFAARLASTIASIGDKPSAGADLSLAPESPGRWSPTGQPPQLPRRHPQGSRRHGRGTRQP